MTREAFENHSARLFIEAKDELVFTPRPGRHLDKKIGKLIRLLKVTDIPVVGITDNVFLIGIYKLPIQQRGDYLQVQMSETKWERFSDYLKENKDMFRKCLTLLCLKN